MSTIKQLFIASLLMTVLAPLTQAGADEDIKDVIADAIANPARPDSDRQQDADRKSLEVLTFAGVKPGDKVADFIPGRGYVTRLFSKIVGKDGHVYAVVPTELRKDSDKAVKETAADPEYPNVSVLRMPVNEFSAPEKLDMVWTSMNYHDLHLDFFGPADMSKLNKAIYDALKPGGIYLVLDHAAEKGSGTRDSGTLHRIDPELVKKEVLAAGFELDAQSDVLNNPNDDHTLKVFDPDIRGKTDKFVFRFRKPSGAM